MWFVVWSACVGQEHAVAAPLADQTRFLLTWRAPAGWVEGGGPGLVSFTQGSTWIGGIKAELARDGLEGVRARHAGSSKVDVEDATLGGQPALVVHVHAYFPRDDWSAWYVVDGRGDTIELSFRDEIPRAEVDAFLGSVAWLPAPPPVPAGARFAVSGTVLEYVGNCMPPSPCTPHPLAATEVVFRDIGADGKVAEIAATVVTDASGRYVAQLPPGRYSVRPVDAGAEVCKSTGPLGPCGLRVFDGPVTYDPKVDHAAW